MKRFRMDRRIAAEVVVAAVASASIVGLAGGAHAAGVSADDSRATVVGGNINSCGALPTLVSGGTSSTTQNGITVTVTHTSSVTPNPFPAGGWNTLPAGTDVLTVTLPAGFTLTGFTAVKGGSGYNKYPGTALTSLIEPVNNGGNIAGLSHFLICGSLTPTTASIKVHKTVVGSGPGSNGTFTVDVNCGAGQDTILTLSDGETKEVDGLADGSSCTVTETNAGGSDSHTYTVNAGSPSSSPPTFDVTGGTTTTVTVTNTYITVTPTPTPTSPTPTPTPTSPTPTPTPTSPTPTPTPTSPTPTPTPTSPTPTPTPTSPTPTPTQTVTVTPTPTITPSITPSGTPTITPTVPPLGKLTIVKSVDKTSANYGDNLKYQLDVHASGVPQTNVTVTDSIPDNTTYVSASCVAPCTVGPPVGGVVTWHIGTMAAGSTKILKLTVNITKPAGETSGLPPETIVNSAVASSTEHPNVPSNEVQTGVTEVLGVTLHRHHHHHHSTKPSVKPTKTTRSSGSLPFTGLPANLLAGFALFAIFLGCMLQVSTWRRRPATVNPPAKRKPRGKHSL